MFTGIVEAVARVEALETRGAHTRLRLAEPRLSAEVALGDSVAVAGACLTVSASGGGELAFDAIRETLERTKLGELAPGDRVNLERALPAAGRFDGHIVQGHVDETGRVRAWLRRDTDVRLHVASSRAFADLLVEKGSVAIDGVSLTVVDVVADGFEVALIPHTLEVTTLGRLEEGSRVNLEADVLGKYVKRYLERTALGRRMSV